MFPGIVVAAQITLAAAAAAPPQPSPPLAIADAVSRARTTSPFRDSAVALVRSADLAARLAGRPLNPLIDVRMENWRPSAQSRPAADLDAFAVVTQPIELGGKQSARKQLALFETVAASASLAALERALAIEAARTYVDALRAREQIDLLEANRRDLSTLVDTLTRRVTEGYTAEADLLKFETESARIDVEMAHARIRLERALASLTAVTGASVPIAAEQLRDVPALTPPAADTASIAAAVTRHPEVVASTAHVNRAQQASALEHLRRIPDPAISAGYKRTAGMDTAVLGLTMSVPLFDRNGTAIARAVGEEQAVTAQREALVRRLTTEATSLIRAAVALRDQATRADRELLEPAEGARNAARAAMREGVADILRLVDAERVYRDVQRTALDLRLDAAIAVVEARFAVGEEDLR